MDRTRATATAGAVARRMREWERSGTEIAVVPLKLRLSLWGGALAPRWHARRVHRIDDHDTP